MELLRQRYEEASSKVSQLRTPLHPVQQKSAINSIPTSSSNIIITDRASQHSSQQQSAQRSALNTLVPSKQPATTGRQRDGVSTSSGCGKEISSERRRDCHSECRKLTIPYMDSTASAPSHSQKHHDGQKSIEHLPQLRHTSDDLIHMGNLITPLTAAAITMTTEVTEMDLTSEGSTEVTPERVTCTLNGSGSMTKRRLKLEEEGTSCRLQTKRRRMSTKDSKSIAKSNRSLQKKNLGQRTMQSYFQPA